jgi:Zn-dependent dipeptidase, microsomal dipeptidase homolog
MSPAELHADSIVIDGLIIAKWNRELFEDMRKGGLTAANCTVSVWEGSRQPSTTSPPARS